MLACQHRQCCVYKEKKKDRGADKIDDGHKLLECKDNAGHPQQHKYNTMFVNSPIKALV